MILLSHVVNTVAADDPATQIGQYIVFKFKFKFKSRLFQLLHISTKIQGTETLLGLFSLIIWP